LRSGFAAATGDIILVQDADLEYSPEDYPVLLEPLISGKADAVFGSRFMGGRPHRVLLFWHMVGNKFLTLLSNMFTNLNLTDIETGYKAFKASVIKPIEIQEDRFGFEAEVIAKLAHTGCRIYEVGISYSGRTYAEGKKINWKDGVRAIYAILKYNLDRRQGGISPQLSYVPLNMGTPAEPTTNAKVDVWNAHLAGACAPCRSFPRPWYRPRNQKSEA